MCVSLTVTQKGRPCDSSRSPRKRAGRKRERKGALCRLSCNSHARGRRTGRDCLLWRLSSTNMEPIPCVGSSVCSNSRSQVCVPANGFTSPQSCGRRNLRAKAAAECKSQSQASLGLRLLPSSPRTEVQGRKRLHVFQNSDPGTVRPSRHARRQRADAVRSASRVWLFHHLHVEHGKTPQTTSLQLTAALLHCQRVSHTCPWAAPSAQPRRVPTFPQVLGAPGLTGEHEGSFATPFSVYLCSKLNQSKTGSNANGKF